MARTNSNGFKDSIDSQGLGSQRDIRSALIEADLVDCMVALRCQLFKAMENFNVTLAA